MPDAVCDDQNSENWWSGSSEEVVQAMPEMKGDAKSLLVSNLYFPPQKGGISHFMGSVATSLGGERVCCLTAVKSDRHEMTVCDKGIRVYRRPLAFSGRTAVQAVSLGFTLSQIMAVERPQIIQLAMAYEGYIGLQLQRWLGLPFVVYAHGNEILDAANGTWQTPRLALMQAARVFAERVERARVGAPGEDVEQRS